MTSPKTTEERAELRKDFDSVLDSVIWDRDDKFDWFLSKLEEECQRREKEVREAMNIHHGKFIKLLYESHVSEEMEKKLFVKHMKNLYTILLTPNQTNI